MTNTESSYKMKVYHFVGGYLYAKKSKCSRRFGWKQDCGYS